MRQLLRFDGSASEDAGVQAWMQRHDDELGAIARHWFERIRQCGADVLEVMHDGAPTACVESAGLAYVNAFKAHVNVGFFCGSDLPDPTGLLEGDGKYMRHVKLRPGVAIDEAALQALITAAYTDLKQRLRDGA